MKMRRAIPILGILMLGFLTEAAGQTFTFVPDDTVLSGPLGSEIVFDCTLTNVSTQTITLALVRTMNSLPAGWESSMCLDVCYPSTMDTVMTTPAFGSSPLNPGESRDFSVHVYTATNPGTGIVRIAAWDTRNPSDRQAVTFTASSPEVGVEEQNQKPLEFSLSECFPNPFNPGTTIRYTLPEVSLVTLKVFNILGEEMTTLASGREQTGAHEVRWDAHDTQGAQLPGGVYFAILSARLLESGRDVMDCRKLLLVK